MKTQTKKLLTTMRSEDFSGWAAFFWLIKKHQIAKTNTYSALRVDMDSKLRNRFKRYLKQQLQGKEFHLAEYDYSNADGDDALFTIDTELTEFGKVAAEIEKGFKNERVNNYEKLLKSWAYVIQFEKGKDKLFAWKKLVRIHNPKRRLQKI